MGDTYYISMIINNARKAMLDNITALDKETLQRELESHLKLEFKYKDELEQSTNNWNELEEWVKSHLDDEFYWFKFYDKMQTIKGETKEIKGRKDVSNNN